MAISAAPRLAASRTGTPSSLCLKMFSITTTEFETRIPTEVEIPIRVIILKLKPAICINTKVDMMDIGIESATIRVERKSCRKIKSIRPVKRIPNQILVKVSLTVDLIKSEVSLTILRLTPAGRSSSISGRFFLTSSDIVTTLASEALVKEICTIFWSKTFLGTSK